MVISDSELKVKSEPEKNEISEIVESDEDPDDEYRKPEPGTEPEAEPEVPVKGKKKVKKTVS
jgi:hypothetical protein